MDAHWVQVYNKPKQQAFDPFSKGVLVGRRYVTQWQALGYRHKISAFGGFDSAQFRIAIERTGAEAVLLEYLGNEVAVIVDNPVRPIFEGYINAVTIDTGTVKIINSLDRVFNRVTVMYSDDTGTERTKTTGGATNADSIAVYGSKMAVFEVGEGYSNGSNLATRTRDARLALQSWPKPITSFDSSGSFNVTIDVKGFYHTWEWDAFPITGGSTISVGAYAKRLTTHEVASPSPSPLPGWNSSRHTGNGNGVFYNDQDLGEWTPNTAWTLDLERRTGESNLASLQRAVDSGQGAVAPHREVIGIGRYIERLGYRRMFYRPANTDIRYMIDAYGDGRVMDLYGYEVPPWEVQPDASVVYTNLLTGITSTSAPTVSYITNVEYDAESGRVKLASEDDASLYAQMQINQAVKSTSSAFGADYRKAFV
ncbi:hypothetical protein HC928_03815 [bacterium]|nr:hypothetical protein [bacterium]